MIAKMTTSAIAPEDQMTPEQIESFTGGYRTVVLPKGFVLWRFISQKESYRFGAFWMEPQTMKRVMETLHTNSNFSQSYKKHNIRNSLAILTHWSHLNYRVQIRLTKEVVAYVGSVKPQKHFTKVPNNMPFGGGSEMEKMTDSKTANDLQYVIPRFGRRMPNNNEWATVTHIAHI